MSKKTIFTGAGVAIITPMNEDLSINWEEYGRIIDHQIANGTDAIITVGTTGEAATMTEEEQVACIRFTVERVAGRVPVIAGAGSNNTAHAVEVSKQAEQAGVHSHGGLIDGVPQKRAVLRRKAGVLRQKRLKGVK